MTDYIFIGKQEIDKWFESTIEGLTRCMSTEAYHSAGRASGEYCIVIHGLNRARERLYGALNIEEKPTPVTMEEIVRKQVLCYLVPHE